MSVTHRARALARRAVGPVARPLLARVYHRVDVRAAEAMDSMLRTSNDPRLPGPHSAAQTLASHLPTLLSAVTNQNAIARQMRRSEVQLRESVAGLTEQLHQTQIALNDRVGVAEQRGEFIRRELLLALRYPSAERGVAMVPEPKVLRPEKLEQRPLRANLGCGHLPLEGYVNVDARELPSVDVVADVRHLPFEPGSVDELHASHLLEHFPLDELLQSVLPVWLDALAPGATLRLILPDASTMITEYAAGRFPFEDLRQVTFGDQEYDGDFHFSMYTPDSARELLETAGFVDVELVEDGRRNGVCYEMELVAHRPATQAASAE